MNIKFNQYKCVAKGAYYGNGNKAVQLIDIEDGGLVATATVNLVEEAVDEDKAFIKDYSENEGMAKALIRAGIIDIFVFGMVDTGFTSVKLYRFTEEALNELW